MMEFRSNHVVRERHYNIGICTPLCAGISKDNANKTVCILLRVDLRGISSNGIKCLFTYITKIIKDLYNPKPKIELKTLANKYRYIFRAIEGVG